MSIQKPAQPESSFNPSENTAQTILRLILPLYFPSLLFMTASSLLIPVLPLFAGEFDIPYTVIGILLSADKIGMLAGDLPAGMFARRLGVKRTMLIGILLAGCSIAALSWSVSIFDTFLYLFISGFGTSLYAVTRHHWITETIPMDQRGRALSLMGGVFRLGRFIGPIIGGAIAAALGLRIPFLIFGLVYLFAFFACLAFVPKIEQQPVPDHQGHRLNWKKIQQMLADQKRTITWAGAGCLLLQMVRSGPTIIIPLFAADVLGLDVQSIGLIISLSSFVDTLLFMPAGFIMDKMGRKVSIVSSAITLSVGIAMIPLSSGFVSLLLVSLLIGFGNGLGSGAMLTLGSDLAPEKMRGEFLGIWRLLGDVGSTGGPLVIGGVAEAFALAQTSYVIAATGVASSLVFAFIVKETLAKRGKKRIIKIAG